MMAGIEDFLRNAEITAYGVMGETDERELLSRIEGIRLFSVPDDPRLTRVELPHQMTVTAEERQAFTTVIAVLNLFDLRCKQVVQQLMQSEAIPTDLSAMALASVMQQSEVLGSITHLLTLVGVRDNLSALMPTELLHAIKLLVEPSSDDGLRTLGQTDDDAPAGE